MKNVAFLIFACDRYELLFKGFDFFFSKNWPNSRDIKKYFTTEDKDIKLQGFYHLKSGQGEWTNRLKRVLDQIEENYIIFIQEDMWFSKQVPEQTWYKIVSYASSNKIKLIKLHSSEVYETIDTGIKIDGFSLSEVNKEKSNFLMSHQVSIWEKEFLYSQLKNNEHPWRNERRGSKRLKKSKEKIYQIDLLSENGKIAINKNDTDIQRGEYYTISENACLNKNVSTFLPGLERHYPQYANKLRSNMESQVTHDGKDKPRKIDIFKRIKNSLEMNRK